MVISTGLRDVMSGSWRQKLNTGSSTEYELVGIDDALKSIMWGLYFIQAQFYEVTKNILMQDSQFVILHKYVLCHLINLCLNEVQPPHDGF